MAEVKAKANRKIIMGSVDPKTKKLVETEIKADEEFTAEASVVKSLGKAASLVVEKKAGAKVAQ